MKSTHTNLVEIWGDTVHYRSMMYSILISTVISCSVFQTALYILSQQSGNPVLLKGYAMLCGLGGCILSGLVCAILFKPKRKVSISSLNHDETAATIHEWYQEHPSSLTNTPPSPAIRTEMQLLNLYDVFQQVEQTVCTQEEKKHVK